MSKIYSLLPTLEPYTNRYRKSKIHSKERYDIGLNRSLKSEIVNYIQDLYENLTELENTSKQLLTDITNPEELLDSIEDFADYYNDTIDFFNNYHHHKNLSSFQQAIETSSNDLQGELNEIGLSITEDKKIAMDDKTLEETLESGFEKLVSTLDNPRGIVHQVLRASKEVYAKPMLYYLNFHEPKYNYNYILRVQNNKSYDSFHWIQEGIIVDIKL